MRVADMLGSHPKAGGNVDPVLTAWIEACVSCAQACTACADACLGEESVQQLVQCIRLNLDCADICQALGAIATRRSGQNDAIVGEMVSLCMQVCRNCAEDCRKHAAMHEHCRICAEICDACEAACRAALQKFY